MWWMRNAPCNTHLRSPPGSERTIPNSRWSWQLGVERVFAIIMASPLHGRCIRGFSTCPHRRSGYGIARRECVQLDLRHIGHRNTMERPITRTTMVASRLGPRSPRQHIRFRNQVNGNGSTGGANKGLDELRPCRERWSCLQSWGGGLRSKTRERAHKSADTSGRLSMQTREPDLPDSAFSGLLRAACFSACPQAKLSAPTRPVTTRLWHECAPQCMRRQALPHAQRNFNTLSWCRTELTLWSWPPTSVELWLRPMRRVNM